MWKLVGVTCDERNFEIAGVNVWGLPWKRLPGECAAVRDPTYQQPCSFSVYAVTDGSRTVEFAAGEFSNGVWGFYVRG